jgi:hypothetical protein
VTEAPAGLPQRRALALAVQRAVCFALSPLTTLAALVLLRGWLRLRFADPRAAARVPALPAHQRRAAARVRQPPHDDRLRPDRLRARIPLWYVLHFASLPWNVPDRNVFAASPGSAR